MATTTRSFKIAYTDPNGDDGTLTVTPAKTGITDTTLADISDNFEHVGYTIKNGYYRTVTKDDLIEPAV